MKVLVTGGAGYIGAHVVRAFTEQGMDVVVIDDLSSGHASFLPENVPFVRGSILDRALVASTLRDHSVTGVVHVAGFKYAGVSVQRPLHTYAQNVTGTASVLAAMERAGLPVRAAGMQTVWTITYAVPSRYNWMLQYYLRAEGLALSWVGTGRLIFSLDYDDAAFADVATRFVAAAERM